MSDSLIHSLWLAVALMLIIEGFLPFLNPAALKRVLLQVATMTEQQLRMTGLLSMSIGLLILYWVN